MKILHTADIHLREYGDDRWNALQTLISIGKQDKIDVFVISGDLFDKEFDAENLRPRIRETFSNNGFKVVIIPGNHDVEAYRQGLFFGEDVVLLDTINEPYEYNGIRIFGIPFESNMDSEKVLRRLWSIRNDLTDDKTNILLYHGELLDEFYTSRDYGGEGERRYMPVRLSFFHDMNVKYVLAGHFHSRFRYWRLDNGGYFVYPGSPVSITKREIGQRMVNVFEVGEKPVEIPVDTFHFQEINVMLDPFDDRNPIEILKNELNRVHKSASVILEVGGYINSEKINMTEAEVVAEINRVLQGKPIAERNLMFRDVREILENDLFRRFLEKLEQTDFDDLKRKQLKYLAIKAMMESRS